MLDRIAAGRTDLVFDWIAQGGSVHATVDGGSLARWCDYYGDVSGLKYLISHGAKLDEFRPNLSLSRAAFHGHWRLCEFLLERGADPNFADPDNAETALHAAFCKRESLTHEHVVRVLINAGADPNRVTLIGAETGGFMRDARTRGETPLHRAGAYGTLGAIRLLLDAGAHVEIADAHGDTALAWASWGLRSTEVLRVLCFEPHRIHPEHLSMEAYLIGHPVGPQARA
jgi:ankyrin repeat protein